jgi:hypothetical protein
MVADLVSGMRYFQRVVFNCPEEPDPGEVGPQFFADDANSKGFVRQNKCRDVI